MISNLADIHKSAKIGENVCIGAFSTIGSDVEIGNNTIIKPNSYIKGPCKIGSNNQIFQFSSIGDDPQDLKFSGESSALEIGDNNVFREYVSINRGTKNGGMITKIGNNNLFITHSHVAHDCKIGNNNIIGNASALAGHVELGDSVTLSGYTMISQYLNIGSFAFTSMGAAITKNIPPFMWIAGKPTRAVTFNRVGMIRNGYSSTETKIIRKAHLLLTDLTISFNKAISEIEALIGGNEKLKVFIDFIKRHKNHSSGIIRR